MSNPAVTTVIADFPAVRVSAMPEWKQNRMKHGDIFVIMRETKNHGSLPYEFKLGSIFGYAVEHGDDPLEAYERNKAQNHRSHWANAMSVMIHNGPHTKVERFALSFGDVIGFEGKQFRIDPAPNNNVYLTPVED